jgi:tRNA G18 (ribose-2'-O)-methylase SpoU
MPVEPGDLAPEPASFGRVTVTTRDFHHHQPGAAGGAQPGRGTAGIVVDECAAAEAVAAPGPCVIACGVVSPVNIGSTYRLMACLDFRSLRRVAGDTAASATQTMQTPNKQKLRSTSKSCEAHVQTADPMALPDFLDELRRGNGAPGTPDRLPIVAIETASGAVDIHSFAWPAQCSIMVGGESDGIPPSVVELLRPGHDHLVVIPMPGPHKSLNVATALAMALFSYRGQHPG